MGRDLNKIYNKAMDYYQKGELKKALEKCEEGISIDLKSATLLNLKGLLLYLKGDLKEAIAIWNINIQINNDEMSRVYIKDAVKDEERLNFLNQAEKNIKELKIDEALFKLNQCIVSDFNYIRVNNALAICFLRKGDYKKALEYSEKSLKIDKNNVTSMAIKKEIITICKNPQDEYKDNILKGVIALGVVGLISMVIMIGFNSEKFKKDGGSSGNAITELDKNDNNVEEKEELVKETSGSEEIEEEVQVEETVDVEENQWVKLSNEEVSEFYLSGSDFFEASEYDKAIEVLEKAYNGAQDNYLHKDILFLLASSYENNKNYEKGIKYYEDYVNQYRNGNSYIEEVYYKLAILYKESNSVKSKEYANKLKAEFPESIYVNTIINEIISS